MTSGEGWHSTCYREGMSNNVECTVPRQDVGGGFGRQTTSRGKPTVIAPIEKVSVPLESFLLLHEYSFQPVNVGPEPKNVD